MSQHVSVKYNSFLLFILVFSPLLEEQHTNIWSIFIQIRLKYTHRRTWTSLFPSLCSLLSMGAQLLPNSFTAHSEGQSGQVTEVALQWAISLSLPKWSECMADKSELRSSQHPLRGRSNGHYRPVEKVERPTCSQKPRRSKDSLCCPVSRFLPNLHEIVGRALPVITCQHAPRCQWKITVLTSRQTLFFLPKHHSTYI